MNKINHFKSGFIMAVFLTAIFSLFILSAPAQAESQAPAIYVKDIQLDKESYDLTKDETTIKGSYTVWSQEEINYVPGIMIQVELYAGSEFINLNLLDVQVEPAVSSLGPKEEKIQSFSYQLSPLLNNGKYTLRIQPVNQKGAFLGWQDKVIDIKGNNQFLKIPAESIFVVIKGQDAMAGMGVPFDADETPKIKFNLTNPSQNTIAAVPKIVIHKRRLNMEKVQELTKEAITLSAGETKTITYDMPQLSEPESYLAAVRFYRDNQLVSNMALFRWVVRGSGAEILGAKLDQDFYQKGETANVRIEYVGPADFSSIRGAVLNVKIYDKKNNLCGEFSEDKIDLMSYSIARTAEVNISRDCLDPKAEIEILKDGKSLDKYEAKVESTSAKAKEYQKAQQKAQQRKILIFALLIIVLILLIWFIFKYFKNKKMPKTLIFFLLVAGLAVFAATTGTAYAATGSISPISSSGIAPLTSNFTFSISAGLTEVHTSTWGCYAGDTHPNSTLTGPQSSMVPCTFSSAGTYQPFITVNLVTTKATVTVTLPSYNLYINKQGTGSGTVTGTGINCGTDCQESYTSGTIVTLTATAAVGSTFASWSGCTPSGNTCTATMTAAKTVYATFNLVETTYNLYVYKLSTGSGTVTSAPAGINCGTDCQESYTSGTSVTLTAAAAAGSTFASWSGCTPSGNTCTVTMSAFRDVYATFNINITSSLTYDYNTVDVGKPVSVTVSVSGSPGATFNYTLRCFDGAATPDVNYWSGTGIAIEADGTNSSTVPCTYSTAGPYTITYIVTPSGGSAITKTQSITVAPLSITNFVADPSGGPATLITNISGKAAGTGVISAETFSINCGNGSPLITGNIYFPGATFGVAPGPLYTCTYNASGNYTVTATVMKPRWNSVSKTLVVNVSSGGLGIGFSPLVVSGTPSIVGTQVYPGQSIAVQGTLSVTSCTNMFSKAIVTFKMGGATIGLPHEYTIEETCSPGTTCIHIGNLQTVPVGPFNATIPTNMAGSLALTLTAEATIYVSNLWGIDAIWCANNGGTWGDFTDSVYTGNECKMTSLTTNTSYNVNVRAPDGTLWIAPASNGPWTPSWGSPNSITVSYNSPVYLKAETWAATRCVASGGWSGTWDAGCSWPGCGGCTYGTIYQTISNIISQTTFNLSAFNPGAESLAASDSVIANIAPPTVDLKADGSDGPITISSGSSATLSWTSANADSCTGCVGANCASTPFDTWPGPKALSGSQPSGSLSSSKTFSITCSNLVPVSASDSVTVNVQGAPPAAPSNLSATAASCSQINLSWTDNSNNETGFKIERKTGAGGSWSQIATVGANVTTYPSTGLSENTTYYYRVRAYNADGDSDYSNEPYATTPLCVVPPGNQAPIAVATISKDGSTYADSIIVTKGVAFPIYLSASGSSDPNGWTDATNGVQPSPGKCEWNSDLNQGAPTYETTINIPDSAASCNISLGSKTFNDAPGTYTYQVLRITDKPGLQSNVDTVSVTVQEAVASTLSVTLSAPSPVAPSQNTTLTAYVSGTAPGPYNYAFWKNCDNPCVTVPTCRTACGNEDQLFTNVSATSKGYDTSYSVLGNHTAKVIVRDPVAGVSDEATTIVVVSNPDFSLSASPSYNRIDRNDQTGKSYTITVNSISGFSSLVNLSVSGLPSGSTAAFVPSSLTPPADGSADSILTIKTNNTPIGSYTITVIGTAGPKTRQTTITLNVAITPWWREIIPW